MDGFQLQIQLVAEKSTDNHVATTMLQHITAHLDLTTRYDYLCDGLTDARVGAGHAATQLKSKLLTAVNLENPKLYIGQMENQAVLDALFNMCKYSQLAYIVLDTYQVMLTLLWLEWDTVVW